MTRNWTNPDDALNDTAKQKQADTVVMSPAHPTFPARRIVQVKWADGLPANPAITDQMCFVEQPDGTFATSSTMILD